MFYNQITEHLFDNTQAKQMCYMSTDTNSENLEQTFAYSDTPPNTSPYAPTDTLTYIPTDTLTDAATDATTDATTDTLTDTPSDIPPEFYNPQKRPPTLDDIKKMCEAQNYKLDPEEFWGYYDGRGWTMGNAPMKNWKSAMLSWEKNHNKKATASGADVNTSEEDEYYNPESLRIPKKEYAQRRKAGESDDDICDDYRQRYWERMALEKSHGGESA
jgi:hypothetical protein